MITIDKAIEIKKKYQYLLPRESYPQLITADNLSIEALKRVDKIRHYKYDLTQVLLPGETKAE